MKNNSKTAFAIKKKLCNLKEITIMLHQQIDMCYVFFIVFKEIS